MDHLEKRFYYNNLFSLYQDLLTDKQQEYYIKHYLEDFTLQEIASDYSLSRNAIFDQIKKTLKILDFYEEKLHLLAKKNSMLLIIDKLKTKNSLDLLIKLENIVKDEKNGI